MIENIIYAAIVGHCEELEHEKVYRGNGHHLAHRLTAMIEKKIFSTLGTIAEREVYEYKEKKYTVWKRGKVKDGFEWKECIIYCGLESNEWYVREVEDFFNKFKKVKDE